MAAYIFWRIHPCSLQKIHIWLTGTQIKCIYIELKHHLENDQSGLLLEMFPPAKWRSQGQYWFLAYQNTVYNIVGSSFLPQAHSSWLYTTWTAWKRRRAKANKWLVKIVEEKQETYCFYQSWQTERELNCKQIPFTLDR